MKREFISLKENIFNFAESNQYPREFISNTGAIKISEDEVQVCVAVVEGSNQSAYDYIEGFHLPKKIKFYNITKSDFAAFIGNTTNVVAKESVRVKTDRFNLDDIAHDAPIVNIINSICIEAIRLNASDIHIECQNNYMRIRYRIDGILKTIKKMDADLFYSISNRIKIMANMNTMEQRLPQDGRLTVSVEEITVDLRVSTVPTTRGESIVLRLFNKSTGILSLDEIGFCKTDLDKIKKYTKYPHGLILLTGPTGSGKSTTLHALIGTMPSEELKIITIEDPVEQIIPGVNQVQINEEINLTFDGMLRRVLRQDPNVIMVGEIRDTVTAELALRSSLTGHLILSTLHTNDSISVISRLCDMGLEPYLIAAVLRCSVAQRLVRKLCVKCIKQHKASWKLAQLYKKYKIKSDVMFVAAGCHECNHTGYKGRTIVAEIFEVDEEIERMISQQQSIAEIKKYANKNGMQLIACDALAKVSGGITSFEEVEREVLF
ncbi:MAG: GspE/PulE family protein [Spirochaetaceae bacterium]|nr:GspE/PulE family protein [Spirochaetaceae bacterium]